MTAGTRSTPGTTRDLVVWRVSDGKPGHDNQSRGLVAALARRRSVQEHVLEPLDARRAVWHLLRRRYPEAEALPSPDLIVGAGHATHGALLAARRARGGRTVVLMRPSLPLSWFDLCVIPAHDRPPQRANVLVTRGALNAVTPATAKDPDAGLILIGGPSRHYQWDAQNLLTQIRAITAAGSPQWLVATSRRTPQATETALRELESERVRLVPWRDTEPGWLPDQLARASVVWISADSVSMVYEALTAGAACGLLHVPAKGRSRISRGIDQLVEQGWIVPYRQWQQGTALVPPREPFDEAGRCARWIEQQWLHAG